MNKKEQYLSSIMKIKEEFRLNSDKKYEYNDLVNLLKVLRAPFGCEWDKAQTHESIKKHSIEEAYELNNAIDKNDIPNMIEEIGDLIMQGIFHIEIATENNEFSQSDVYTRAVNKLISRHTHIFGSDTATDEKSALSTWDNNKIKEKGLKSHSENLRDVPLSFPSLLRAKKVTERARKSNFDWDNIYGPFDKIYEELEEVKAEIFTDGKLKENIDNQKAEKEIGDLLFSIVNVCRFLSIDPEIALTKSTEIFIERFSKMEEQVTKQGKKCTDLTLEELDKIWEKVK